MLNKRRVLSWWTLEGEEFLTSGADSNCRKRFCRPSPIHSVTRLSKCPGLPGHRSNQKTKNALVLLY